MSDTVAQWLMLPPHSEKTVGLILGLGLLCVESVGFCPVSVWILSWLPLPPTKNLIRFGNSKLNVGVDVSVNDCLSLRGPVTKRWLATSPGCHHAFALRQPRETLNPRRRRYWTWRWQSSSERELSLEWGDSQWMFRVFRMFKYSNEQVRKEIMFRW